MYTLEDIYNYLDTGVAGIKRTDGFTGPSSPPSSTGHDLNDIHGKIADRCITCDGTLTGTRWCDQGGGTVKDMRTGLVWLKNANCTQELASVNKLSGRLTWDNAVIWSSALKNGDCGLSDGSVEGDWRLPTKTELQGIGTDPPAKWPTNFPSASWSKPNAPLFAVKFFLKK